MYQKNSAQPPWRNPSFWICNLVAGPSHSCSHGHSYSQSSHSQRPQQQQSHCYKSSNVTIS